MFRASANILLWAFIAGAVVIGAFLAVDAGLIDAVFGTTTQSGLQSCKDWVRRYLSRSDVETALKGLGVLSSGIGIILTAQRLWEYAERNLPERLQQLADQLKASHSEDRELLLAPYATRNLSRAPIYQDSRGMFDQFLGVVGYDKRTREEKRILHDAKIASDQRQNFQDALARSKSLSISALIFEAAKIAFDPEALRSGQGAQIAALQAAEEVINKALKIVPDDLDALELAAKIAAARDDYKQASERLKQLQSAAATAERSVRLARAWRLQAEITGRRTTIAARKEAKDQLEKAFECLDGPDKYASHRERHLEEAQIHEQLAGIYILRKTLSYVQDSINAARVAYGKVGGEEQRASVERLRDLAESKRAAEVSGEAPEDDADVGTGKGFVPSHYTVQAVDVLVSPAGPIIFRLEPHMGVRVERHADNGAYIKIAAGQKGFVAGNVLQRLG